jgi:hypothetical protein
MSDVVVTVVESNTSVTVTEQDVAVAVTETNVDVSSSTAGIQGASYAQGDPIYVTVRNATGATLAKGTIVYISGSNGNHVQVTPAIATSDATSARTLGWLAESIANNASGLCQVEGYLEGLNTQGFTSGNQLYLSGTVAGAFTATKPQAPIHLVYVGVATKISAGDGHVFVKVQNGYELEELHDVQIISVANNDLIKYDLATDLWKNVQPSTLSVGTATYATTSGTAVYATTSGTATYATLSGTAVNISGTVTQAQVTSLTTDLANRAKLDTANAFTVGGHVITNAATAVVPLVLKGFAGQTGDLLQIQNNGATNLAVVSSTGTFRTAGLITAGNVSNVLGQLTVYTTLASRIGAVIQGAASQSANLQEWQTSAGGTAAFVDPAGRGVFPTVLAGAFTTAQGAHVALQTTAATNIGVLVRGAASQSANLQEWQTSTPTTVAKISAAGVFNAVTVSTTNGYSSLQEASSGGNIFLSRMTASATNPGSNNARLYFRDGTNTGTLKLVVRAGAAGAETTILDNIPQ